MASDEHWVTTLILLTSSIVAITANSLLLVVFFRRRGLRTVSNRFVINLLVTNLLSSVFLVPLLIIDQSNSSTSELVENYLNISTEISLSNVSLPATNELVFKEEKEEIINENSLFVSDKITLDENNLEIVNSEVRNYAKTNTSGSYFNMFLCYFAKSTTNLICTASIFSILLIGIDQYYAIVHPLRYHSYIDKCKSTVLLATCWLLSLTLAALDTLISTDSNFWKFCRQERITRPDQKLVLLHTVYSFAYFVLVILIPFVTICVIYVCIYTAARRNSERMRKSNSANSTANLSSYTQLPVQIEKQSSEESLAEGPRTLPKVQSAPNFINLENLSEKKTEDVPAEAKRAEGGVKVTRSCSERMGKSIIVSLKYRISNVSVFKYREETRAAKISILVIFMVLICYAPYGLAVLLSTDIYKSKIPRFFNYVSLILLVVSNIMSPFLFAYRNRRIQRELFKFLRLIPQKSTGSTIRRNSLRRRSVGSVAPRSNVASSELKAVEENELSCTAEPFLNDGFEIPQVVVSCKVENEKKSIMKRVCSKNWTGYKKCNFITLPDNCLDARGSFSSASTQISTED